MNAADKLDQIEARANAATEGPWFVSDGSIWVDRGDGNADGITGPLAPWCFGEADFVAHARTDVPALVAALQAVLELHKPITEGVIVGDCAAEECEHDGDCPEVPIDLCACCYDLALDANPYYGERDVVWVRYPCPTVRVIEAALS